MAQTVALWSMETRRLAKHLIDIAPEGGIVKISGPARSTSQNSKMWPMLSDISRAKPEGRLWVPETWKCGFMHVLGHQVRFAEGLDGSGPFPIGFHSSRLSKSQMAELITCISEYGDRHGVRWSDEVPA